MRFILIKVTDFSNNEKYLNPDLIEKMELIPDTLLTLTSGRNMIVREGPSEIIGRIVDFRRKCNEKISNPLAIPVEQRPETKTIEKQ